MGNTADWERKAGPLWVPGKDVWRGAGGADRAHQWSLMSGPPSLLAPGLLLERQGGPTEHPDPSRPMDSRTTRHHYCELHM